jgi:hypothetical protein
LKLKIYVIGGCLWQLVADISLPRIILATSHLPRQADMSTAALLVQPPPGVTLVRVVSDTPAALEVGAISPPRGRNQRSDANAAAAAAAADPGAGVAGLRGTAERAKSAWVRIPLQGKADGRPRLTLTYSDNSTQVINYRTLPPFDQHIDQYGAYQASTTFYTEEDAFKRSPSFMPWDRELNRTVLDDPRNYDVGLSDDAGAGANVGFASKMRYRPIQSELETLDTYINSTLWGKELDSAAVPVSLQDHSTYGIKSSMFWVPLHGARFLTTFCTNEAIGLHASS